MTDRSRLSEDLMKIDETISLIAAKAEEALLKALSALRRQDMELAREVKLGDAEVDKLQREIEDLAAVALATQQPVASDLRILVAAFKVAADFERAADHAVHLAKATGKFSGEPRSRLVDRLARMAEIDGEMIRGTAEAFRLRSADLAAKTAALDDIVDGEHKALMNEVLEMMRERPEAAEKAAKLLTTSGHLERLGDHMTNACEDIVFMISGSRVELNA
ncbi:MAG TPA: phosphate signaling complex protein PhoU [Rectinemataceae bacterium]|nr:phosphate signaling complex protein PhoU [Rectinemataceae bacterium]